MNSSVSILIVGVVAIAAGIVVGFFIRKYLAEAKISSAESVAKKTLVDAKKEAEAKKKEAILSAKDEIYAMRKEAEKEDRKRRSELQHMEKRFAEREEGLVKKIETMEEKAKAITSKEAKISELRQKLEKVYSEEKEKLERVASMSPAEARDLLFKRIVEETKHEAAKMIKEIEGEAREEGEKRARNIISLAIQRCAADHVAETTVSVVPLPNDEMKGRIIGREGRNIRAFEMLTGINLIIDDTPGAVILSSFGPVRREVARITLEKLILDGRIHPARIEEMYKKAEKEVDDQIREVGEQTTFDIGVQGLYPELIKVLGRLKYRTSFGQNVLKHSLEVAHIAGIMASEIGADVKKAKRAGLIHDIGKAIDQEVEGPHALIGSDLAKRLKEKPDICHAIKAHHGDIEPETVVVVLVQAADAVSAARPGARRETLESYVKRLEKLETIAEGYEGVDKTYAMQAGREIRIMVKPDKIADTEAEVLARDVAKKIEEELDYPGQVKVMVIRERRAVEYAK